MNTQQYKIVKNNVINNISFSKKGYKIIVKVPCREEEVQTGIYIKKPITVNLFLNNNPYVIRPAFDNNGQWELDTQGAVLINSIKFDYITKNQLNNNESIYVTVFYD